MSYPIEHCSEDYLALSAHSMRSLTWDTPWTSISSPSTDHILRDCLHLTLDLVVALTSHIFWFIFLSWGKHLPGFFLSWQPLWEFYLMSILMSFLGRSRLMLFIGSENPFLTQNTTIFPHIVITHADSLPPNPAFANMYHPWSFAPTSISPMLDII